MNSCMETGNSMSDLFYNGAGVLLIVFGGAFALLYLMQVIVKAISLLITYIWGIIKFRHLQNPKERNEAIQDYVNSHKNKWI